jgi:hypothetical protein
MLQRVLQFRDFFAVKLRKVGVGNNSHAVLLGLQLNMNFPFTSLQASQLITHGAGISVTCCYEV